MVAGHMWVEEAVQVFIRRTGSKVQAMLLVHDLQAIPTGNKSITQSLERMDALLTEMISVHGSR